MCLFRRTTRLWGRDAICPALRAYLDTAMGRMAELGARLVVFGSGPARATPPGYDRHRVPGQILDFLALAAEAAAPYDLDIVIEPLWREKCDTINTVLEAAVVARQTEIPRVAALADWWHMRHEREPLTTLAEARDRLRHVHVPVPPLPSSHAPVHRRRSARLSAGANRHGLQRARQH